MDLSNLKPSIGSVKNRKGLLEDKPQEGRLQGVGIKDKISIKVTQKNRFGGQSLFKEEFLNLDF